MKAKKLSSLTSIFSPQVTNQAKYEFSDCLYQLFDAIKIVQVTKSLCNYKLCLNLGQRPQPRETLSSHAISRGEQCLQESKNRNDRVDRSDETFQSSGTLPSLCRFRAPNGAPSARLSIPSSSPIPPPYVLILQSLILFWFVAQSVQERRGRAVENMDLISYLKE